MHALHNEQDKAIVAIIDVLTLLIGRKDVQAAPDYIVKSICNCIAIGFRIILTKANIGDRVKEIFAGTYGSQDLGLLRVGLYLADLLLSEVMINSHNIGYFNYCTLINEFSNQNIVHTIFDHTYNVLMQYLYRYVNIDPTCGNALQGMLEVMFKLLIFPFENSFITFSTDLDLSEHSTCILPHSWSERVFSIKFLELLLGVAVFPNALEGVRVEALKVLSMLAACRLDSNITPEQQSQYMCFQMLVPVHMINFYTSMKRPPSKETIEPIVDLIGRLMRNFRIFKMSKLKEEFCKLLETMVVLSKIVFVSFPELDNRTLSSLLKVWGILVDQYTYVDYGIMEYMESFFQTYLEVYFGNNDKLWVLNLSEELNPEYIEKMISKRFRTIREVFTLKKENLIEPLRKLVSSMASEMGRVKANFRNTNVQRQDIKLFITKFVHFELFIIYMLFGVTYTYGYHSYLNKLNEDLSSMVFKDAEAALESLKAEAVGSLFGETEALISIVSQLSDPSFEHTFVFCLTYFISSIGKKLIEKVSIEDMNTIDKGSSGLIRGRMLLIKWEWANQSINHQVLYSTPQQMLDQIIIILINLLQKMPYLPVSKYLLYTLNEIFEKLKKALTLEDFTNFPLLSEIISILLKMNKEVYLSVDHKGQRRRILEIVGGCYFEDENDDYLSNIRKMADTVLAQHLSPEAVGNKPDNALIKTFADVTGMMAAVSSTKVAIGIIRICYPRVREALNKYGEQILSHETFLQSMMKFYLALNDFVFDKLSTLNCLIYFEVLRDTFRMMSKLATQMFNHIGTLEPQALVAVLKEKHQFISDALSIFVGILRKKNLDLCTFQYFGDMEFVNYLTAMFKLISIVLPYLDYFPAESMDTYMAFTEIDNSIHEIFFHHFDTEIYELFFNYLRLSYIKFLHGLSEGADSRTITDENKLYSIKNAVMTGCKFLLKEVRIKGPGSEQKVAQIRSENNKSCEDFLLQIFKAFFSLNYGERARDMMIELAYVLIGFAGDKIAILTRLKEFISTTYVDPSKIYIFNEKYEPFVQACDFQPYSLQGQLTFKKNTIQFIDQFIKDIVQRDE